MTKTSPFNIISESKGGWGENEQETISSFFGRIQRNQKDKEREREIVKSVEKKNNFFLTKSSSRIPPQCTLRLPLFTRDKSESGLFYFNEIL